MTQEESWKIANEEMHLNGNPLCKAVHDAAFRIATENAECLVKYKTEKVAEFLHEYCFCDTKEVYTNGVELVPMHRVLDALSMINQNEIEYKGRG